MISVTEIATRSSERENTHNLTKIRPKKYTYDLPPLKIGIAPEKRTVSRNVLSPRQDTKPWIQNPENARGANQS